MILGWEQFAADLAAARGEEFVRDFVRTLTDEQRAEEEVAFASQRRIAAATEDLDECFVDGLGECHMRVDLTAYWHWTMRYGRQIWNDPSFIREYKRDNPEVVVRPRSRKIQVGYR
jgi:hypothetical protein